MPKVPTGESHPQPGGSNIAQVERSRRVEVFLVRLHRPMSTAWCGSALHSALVVTELSVCVCHLSGRELSSPRPGQRGLARGAPLVGPAAEEKQSSEGALHGF